MCFGYQAEERHAGNVLRNAELTYSREHYNGISYNAVIRNFREYATDYARFDRIGADGAVTPVRSMT